MFALIYKIVLIVQIRALKIYIVGGVEVIRKKERQDESRFPYYQNWWKN